MRWLVLALALALIGTNAWWFYKSVDHGVTDMYRQQVCTEDQEAQAQSLVLLRLVKGQLTRRAILEAAQAARSRFGEPFDKDGELHAGRLAFKLDEKGNVTALRKP